MNPDLMNPASGGTAVAVPALVAITLPMENTKQDDFVYFHCTMAVAAMHRPDGKKLPFLQHVLKTNIREDIAYLDREIAAGNNYIRRATLQEVQAAQILEDPMGAVRDAVKKELSIEDLEALLAQRRAAVASGADRNNDAAKIAGVDVNTLAKKALAAVDAQNLSPRGQSAVSGVGGTNTTTAAPLAAASLSTK